MHELSVVINVVEQIEEIAKENELTEVDTIVLQIGELSSMIPKYVEECFPAAIDGTFLHNTKLQIEILPGNCRCKKCEMVFNLDSRNL